MITLKECSSSDYNIIITTPVERKIRYLCNQCPTLEWSGVLFYTYKGSFEENDLTIECKDIHLMDVGSAGATEFNMDETVAGYLADNPELLSCQMGLIHSHNTMSTFFSGTDLNTLKEEGNSRNIFVSLIVNNEGTYTAGITRKVVSVCTTASYEFFGEGKKEIPSDKTIEEIEWFRLNIIKEENAFSFPELSERLTEIRKSKQQHSVKSFPQDSTLYTMDDNPWESFKKNNKKDKKDKTEKQNKLKLETEWQEKISSTVNKLVTACPIMSNQKLDIRKWVASSMPQIYKKTFGTYVYGKELDLNSPLQQWFDNYVDYILRTVADDSLTQAEYNQEIADIALDVVTILEDLPQNDYLKLLIDVLKEWYDEVETDTKDSNYLKFDF